MHKSSTHLVLYLIGISIFFLLTSCSIDDERDLCCERITLHYRYVRQESDEYKSFIRDMRHFLFDDQGLFIKELPSNKISPQNLRLENLPKGTYTVVTIANATKINTQLTQLVNRQSSIDSFRLLVVNQDDKEEYNHNSDELFWNVRTFTAIPKETQHYICDLSNIHCHLFVHVTWHVLPKYEGLYSMRLSQVPIGYLLNPSQSSTILIKDEDPNPGDTETALRIIHRFPALSGIFGQHEIKVPLYDLKLDGEFITLRYTNNHIPIFQLFYGDEAVSKPIDLSRAFSSWGWRPDEHTEQIYRIEMEIFEDGTVIVNQVSDTAVLDWQDGGVIGVAQ